MTEKTEKDGGIQPSVSTPTSIEIGTVKPTFTKDEFTLAKLGYKQDLVRGLGLFEGWASVLTVCRLSFSWLET